jgi:aryl-alcohol dehydrogenase-like predicted oxidoreductase
VLGHPQVTAVVVGPRRPEQLVTAVAATQLELTAQERDELAALFA